MNAGESNGIRSEINITPLARIMHEEALSP